MSLDTKGLVSFFDNDLLVSLEDVQHALLQCNNALTEQNIEPLLRELASWSLADRPLLELMLSGGSCSETLSTWIINHFPATRDEYALSTVFAIITKLSFFLLFAYPFDRKTFESLNIYRHRVELTPKALAALAAATFDSVELDKAESDEDDWGFIKSQKASQRQRKRSKRIAAKATILFDPKLFQSLQLSIPTSPEEAEKVSKDLIDQHKAILKFYLDRLRDPDVAVTIQKGFVRRDVIQTTPALEGQSESSDVAVEGTEAIASAYPMVQPMKAALYFDSADGFGEWRILISTRADRDLREARRKDAKFFKIVIKKIKELSNGHLSDDNHKRLNGQDTEIPIYEAKMTRDTRIVYQVDCIPEYDVEVERQVIKIFGIYTHAQIDKRLWDSMGRQLGRKGKQYRDRCTFRNRPHHVGDSVILPACFPPPEKSIVPTVVPELPKEDLEEIHSLLVLEKFVTLSQALLNSIIADLDVAHVFNVTPQEKEIIEHPYSCYVLGRSGTGKTTTMLFKMLGIERAFKLKQTSMGKPRQIFVTQSRVLAAKVEEYFSKLLDSLSTAGRSRQELAQLAKEQKLQSSEHGLIDLDDDINWRADLPLKFSLLKDEHFPLFLTFDRLLSMLEADFSDPITGKKGVELSPVSQAVEPVTPVYSRGAGKLVTYSVFLESCWPHFSETLRKGLDPSLVFSELMGVIQGSEEALSHEHRFLDKHAYKNLSHRAQYTFANQRDTVYSIFQAYIKQKRACGDFDAADRTHNVLKVFDAVGLPGQKIDYLYVDEAQDNLLIDALLLRSLCRNPNGLFWAGDTAQTISVGSSFRFNDLKAFLFRLEQRRENTLDQHYLHLAQQEPPHTFQLAINYRSHGGIVHCADSVIELITQFWPYAIDVLAREQGVVDGSKPVFFSGWNKDTVRYEQFLFGTSGSRIEFGAQQCILVRDDSARDELRQQVGDIGLILTLYESKGLEFDDVLLYKFFEDSTVELSQWRVVLNLLGNESNLDIPAPCFEESRHAGVCSELKFLYVAITRARKNLWIVDCSDKCEPMRLFWTSRKQIQHCTPGMDVPLLAVSSSPEEWEKSGRSLFQNKRYLQALHCFERAGLSREVVVSRTYYLREQARLTPAGESRKNRQTRTAAFLVAAKAFLECAKAATNATYKRVYYRNAGDCFERAEEKGQAACAYLEAQEYTTAAKLFRGCAKFDEAVDVVKRYRQEMDAEIAQNIFDVARLFYFRGGELQKAGNLFDSDEEQLEYLEDYDLDVSRAAVLKELGRYKEAAEIHLAEGRALEAIHLFLMTDDDQYAVQRGHACILQGLWRHLSFAVMAKDGGEEAVQLLELASNVKLTSTDPLVNDELAMFRAIKSSDSTQLRDLAVKFEARKEVIQALLCFDHYFNCFPNIVVMEASELSKVLDGFHAYCRLLFSVAITPDSCNSPLMQKLFCIHPSTEKVFMLPTGTFLHKKIVASRAFVTEAREDGVLINEWDLARRLREYLFGHLRMRVIAENDMCQRTMAFAPCLNFAINNSCNRVECPRGHVSHSSFTHAWYNLQVKIHFQQILIFHTLHAIPMNFLDRVREHRYWINRLHETLHPSIYYLGTVASLDVALIPDAYRAIEVVKGWSRDFLYSRHQWDARKSLTTVYQVVNLCFYVDRTNARQYVHNAPVFNAFDIPIYRRHLGGDDSQTACVVRELARSLQGTENAFITVGILFVKQVVDKMLAIDTLVLCDVIDYLCGSIILVYANYALHNVTLPRSWFINLLWRHKRDIVNAERNHITHLIGSVKQLLERLQGGAAAGHLLFEKKNLSDNVGIARQVFITRLCRSICLLGYNINNHGLREEILKSMNSLTANSSRILYWRYAQPGAWRDLSKAVHQSTTKSPLDEMIQLYHESKKPGRSVVPRGVRRVFYKAVDDVPRLLSEASAPSFLSSLRVDAPAFVPRQIRKVDDDRPTEVPNSEDAGAEVHEDIEEPEVDHTDVMNNATAIETIANSALPVTVELPSEEKIHAMGVFQKAFRKVLVRRRNTTKTVAEASRTSFFEACLAEASKMDWPHGGYYRKLFLGPLPHVLVCLGWVLAYVTRARDKAKERFTKVTHQELDDVGKKLTELNGLLKTAKRLQTALQPKSEKHRKPDVEELKTHVLEVEKLLDRLQPTSTREVKEDMDIALKGIVMTKKPPKAKPRPDLQLDDDFEDFKDIRELSWRRRR